MIVWGNCLLVLLLSCASFIFVEALNYRSNVSQESLKRLATANNDLALNLHRQLATQTSGNIFFSPLSLSTAFGMLYYGTKGNTAKELRRALGYDTAGLGDELVHPTFQKYLTEYLTSQDPSSYVINSANAILLDKHLNLVSSYRNAVQTLYQAAVEDVDFVNQAPQIVGLVNDWVRQRTNNKIDKLLEDLDPSTVLILLNAVYFKGVWKTQFESSNTRPQTFYNNGLESGAKEVPMMRITETFPYASVVDVQALELPYKGENLSMLILLPNKLDGLASLESTLTLNKISAIRRQLYKSKVHVTLPKFKTEYTKEMSGDFKSLGAQDVFSPGADVSGISADRNIFVTQVLHKAVVEINEEGSEAAAVTGIISNRMRPMVDLTPEFVANHPFLFAIVDRRNDMILFMGRVTNL